MQLKYSVFEKTRFRKPNGYRGTFTKSSFRNIVKDERSACTQANGDPISQRQAMINAGYLPR